MIVDVPSDRRRLGKGREAESDSAARDGVGGVNVEVIKRGIMVFAHKDSDASFVRVGGAGGEDVEGIVDGSEGEEEGFAGAMHFLEKHDVNRY